jgi:glycosyltransferase involved in cell wall biosynthesis
LANRNPEGFSLAFMEALAARLPIVTADIGGAPELVDDSCGILVPAGDVSGFARALRELIINPQRRRQLGAAGGYRLKELCDPATQVMAYRDILAAA